ncbi:uncharacterized protein LOC120351900 [Nilaparvata lugens]|uniref:uncharacterized protein LOC120351900 n=1 Tax=Nilaparvata lugens TaxID=108931 RepID=UPI00193EB199|nr:uncharacterized protein LOC120351900 [Nilaparvata lugens]XP_039286610.1 uncharacterized protein LOC120351900 [Nilaparvata lugens]
MSDNKSILSAIADFRKENKINWDANNNRWDTNVQKLKQVQEDVKKTNLEISLIKEQFAAVTSKCDSACQSVELLRQDNSKLRKELDVARGEINDLQQHTRKNNILVSGVPLTKGENMFTVLDAVARAINVSFKEWDISAAHRLPNRNRDANMPPSIVVNFTSRFTKSSWLTARRLKGRLSASELNTNFPNTPVYLSEHLTPVTRSLFNAARQLLKEKKLISVWTRDCKVMVKAAADHRAFLIRDLEQIAELRRKDSKPISEDEAQ